MKRPRTVFAGIEFALGHADRVPRPALLKILRSGRLRCYARRIDSEEVHRQVAAASLASLVFEGVRAVLVEPLDPQHETVIRVRSDAREVEVTLRECDDAEDFGLSDTHARILVAPDAWTVDMRGFYDPSHPSAVAQRRAVEDLVLLEYIEREADGKIRLSPAGLAKREELRAALARRLAPIAMGAPRQSGATERRRSFRVIRGGKT